MAAFLLDHEPWVRLAAFAGIFAAMALLERAAPRRVLSLSRGVRWSNNLAVVLFNSLLVRLIFPASAVGAAWVAAERGWGLFNQVDMPAVVEVAVAVLLLDLLIYGQHVAFHKVPLLWRLHRMHHMDLDVDVTTGSRFHPVEILASMAIKVAAVAALGAAPLAVLLFEVILNGLAMFNHANVRLPDRLDRALRRLVVTPDMHRVHHSIRWHELDSNFGFNLSLWDRLFRTYRAQPQDGHTGMVIGVEGFRAPADQWLHRMLWSPLRRGRPAGRGRPQAAGT
jgi:sterol desaturase/sphingolipid hydroxylase (fatty acid hydroxylase superfamily)